MKKKSVYLIKPEGMPYRHKIQAMITSACLNIVASKLVYLSPKAIRLLYPDTSPEMMVIILRSMLGKLCEMGLVTGKNALAKLVTICGDNTNPTLCAEGTIRRTFAEPNKYIRVGEKTFYGNIIHRPQNQMELERDLKLFKKL